MANELYLFPTQANPNDIGLRDNTVGGASFTVAVAASQASATASAVLAERFVASVTASQSSATASATLAERFVASVAASQAPATASATMAERFVASVTASQAGHTASATMAERFVASVSATQGVHIASGTLAVPAVVVEQPVAQSQSGSGGGYAPRIIPPRSPQSEPQQIPSLTTRVAAAQSAHQASAVVGTIPRHRIAATAFQSSHECAVGLTYDHLNVTDEDALLVFLIAA